jgi:hypothetical protein
MHYSSTVCGVVSGLALLLQSRAADALEFPFEAVVIADQSLVRSGTGGDDTDYTTIKLRRGDKVRVLHQEFGGWYKIAPPEGSFSWVREDLVERTGDQGVILQDTMDIIGSESGSPKFEVRNLLRKSEVVEILSKVEELDRGPRSTPMLRIRPPRGEFRFIRQRDVVPASEYVEQPALASNGDDPSRTIPGEKPARDEFNPFTEPNAVAKIDSDPFEQGSSETELVPQPIAATGPDAPGQLPGGANFELARTVPRGEASTESAGGRLPESASQGVSMAELGFQAPGLADPTYATLSNAEKKQIEAAWDELKRLDEQFRTMRQKPVVQWTLPELKRRYESLQQTPDTQIQRQVERRLAGLARYETIFQEFAEVQNILRRTEDRDEQIRQSYLSRRQSVSMQKPVRTIVRPSDQGPSGPPAAASRGFTAGPPPTQPGTPPQVQPPQVQPRPQIPTQPAPIVRQPLPQQPRYDGAGIVQRATSPRGGARHILVAPDGRVLAYLQGAPGINLDQFLGQSLGLIGPRQFRRDLNADFMVVRRLSPVRLRP